VAPDGVVPVAPWAADAVVAASSGESVPEMAAPATTSAAPAPMAATTLIAVVFMAPRIGAPCGRRL